MKKIIFTLIIFLFTINAHSEPICTITTVAGNGQQGYSGDGGLATNAKLEWPWNIAVDSNDNLYISDSGYIRKVDSQTKNISTIYINPGGTGHHAFAFAVNDSFLYFSFTGTSQIFRINLDGSNITAIAGKPTPSSPRVISGNGGQALNADLGYLRALEVDEIGNILTGESLNNNIGYIRKISSENIITIIGGNGTTTPAPDNSSAMNSGFYYPTGIKTDLIGNVYIADRDNNIVRKIDSSGIIKTIAGNGQGSYTNINYINGADAKSVIISDPYSLAIDEDGNIFIGIAKQVLMVDTNGKIWKVAGNPTINGSCETSTGNGGSPFNAKFSCLVYGLAFGPNGDLYIGDHNDHTIRKISCTGGTLAEAVMQQTGNDNYNYNGNFNDNNNFNYNFNENFNSNDNAQVVENSTRPCSNACGEGVETYQNGAWVNCSAPTSQTVSCGTSGCVGTKTRQCTSSGWGVYSQCSSSGRVLGRERCISKGTGACATSGFYICSPMGTKICNATPLKPTREICDNIDNNCNGQIDEGLICKRLPFSTKSPYMTTPVTPSK